jgi:hypothetical protein
LNAHSEEESTQVDEGVEHRQQTLPGLQEPVEVHEHVTGAGVARARSLPAFLHREPLNTIQDFLWGRHARLYLAQCRRACRLTRKELLSVCGLASLNKLDRFREGWHDLVRPIPRSYLQALEVDLGLLEDVVELDRREFARVLALPRFPRSLVVNLLPGAYHNRPFPLGTPEDDAVEILRRTAKEMQRIAWIHYPDLLTITAWRYGRMSQREYWPELRVTPRQVGFGDRGLGIGTISVGGRRY